MHIELRRPGVTLRLLHEEYLGLHAGGYGYTQFVTHYRAWVLGSSPGYVNSGAMERAA